MTTSRVDAGDGLPLTLPALIQVPMLSSGKLDARALKERLGA